MHFITGPWIYGIIPYSKTYMNSGFASKLQQMIKHEFEHNNASSNHPSNSDADFKHEFEPQPEK